MGFFSVVISRVISPLIWVISIVTLLITLLFTTPAELRRVAWSALRGCEALELSGSGPRRLLLLVRLRLPIYPIY